MAPAARVAWFRNMAFVYTTLMVTRLGDIGNVIENNIYLQAPGWLERTSLSWQRAAWTLKNSISSVILFTNILGG